MRLTGLLLGMALLCVAVTRMQRRRYVVRDDWRRYAVPAAAAWDRRN
jgi:hypothetical protein